MVNVVLFPVVAGCFMRHYANFGVRADWLVSQLQKRHPLLPTAQSTASNRWDCLDHTTHMI